VNKVYPAEQRVFAFQIRSERVLVEHCAKLVSHFWVRNEDREIHVKIVIFALRDFVGKVGISGCDCRHEKPVMRPPDFCVKHEKLYRNNEHNNTKLWTQICIVIIVEKKGMGTISADCQL